MTTEAEPHAKPLRVLCLDIEGGFGGSSRSLYYSLKHMRPGAVAAEVWCRKAGPIESAYQAIGIASRQEPRIATATAIARVSRTLVDAARAATSLFRNRRILRQWAEEINQRFDLVHFNHEGLLLLAFALRQHCRMPFTFHIRRLAPAHIMGRLQHAAIARIASHAVCISEGEAGLYRKFGSRANCSVISNIVEIGSSEAAADPAILSLPGTRVASLANYSWARGVDQLVDVARELKERGRHDFHFVTMGNLNFTPSLPEEKSRFGDAPTSVAAFANNTGVADMFHFTGSVPDPEPILSACHLLAKPARQSFPWGRDILEAMAAGKPVITIGTESGFVESGITGELMPYFDPARFADALIEMSSDPERQRALGENARRRVQALCDPITQADALLAVWRSAAAPK